MFLRHHARRKMMAIALSMLGQLGVVWGVGAQYNTWLIVWPLFFILYPRVQRRFSTGPLFVAFFLGGVVDLLYQSWGVHMCSGVLMVYMQPWCAPLFFGAGDSDTRGTSRYGRWRWPSFLVWAALLLLIYHGAAGVLMGGLGHWSMLHKVGFRFGIGWLVTVVARFFLR